MATPPGFAPSWRSAKPSVFERFLNEVQITAQLEHPNIVPIYGLEVAPDGAVAYAMKLVRGRELRKLVLEARGRRSW